MNPTIPTYERRRSRRIDMTTRDCRLMLLRVRGGKPERENAILVNLSYAGLRFHGLRPIGQGEALEFLVDLGARSTPFGYVRARVCWVRPLDSHWCDCGVEFFEESKGLLAVESLPQDEWNRVTATGHNG
jgi:PilZ domain-containing protein